jgi:hypothetical protein
MAVKATLILRVRIDEVVGETHDRGAFEPGSLVEIGITGAPVCRPVTDPTLSALQTRSKQIEMARPEMPFRTLAVTSMPGRFLLWSGVIEIRRLVHLHLRLGKQEIARTGKHSERQIPEKNGHDGLLLQTEPRRKNMDTKAHTR